MSRPADQGSHGYARITVDGAFHLWAPRDVNPFHLIPACRRELMLPRRGAKLKARTALTPAEVTRICRDCAAKDGA